MDKINEISPLLETWNQRLEVRRHEPVFLLGASTAGGLDFSMHVSGEIGKEFLILALQRAIKEIRKKKQVTVGGVRMWK